MFSFQMAHVLVGVLLSTVTLSWESASTCRTDETATVEVFFARENVPAEVKAATQVQLLRLDGRTVTPAGKVSQTTSMLVPHAVVVSVTQLEKPASPEQAVKVVLRVKDSQVRIVERAKSQMVNVMEIGTDGSRKVAKKPVTLLLELSK